MSEREGFPFPMEPMHGGWEVDRYGDDGCQVSVWWAFRTKPSWLAPLLIPVMERQVQVDMRKAIDSMGVMAQSLPVADT